ncbi:MAG: hypothetical protein ACK5EA_21100 [Planctomycetaceae bacterium]|jgi:hypothetical protein
MNDLAESLDLLIGREVVLDTASPYVILGRLANWNEQFLVLEQADVHDLRDTSTTRENYIVDSLRHGIRINRRRVFVSRRDIVCFSALNDVIC